MKSLRLASDKIASMITLAKFLICSHLEQLQNEYI